MQGSRGRDQRTQPLKDHTWNLGNTFPEPLSFLPSAMQSRSVGERRSAVLSLFLTTHHVPEGVAEAEERGTKNSQVSSVRGREPRQHLPWVGRGPSPCHGWDRGSKTVWVPDVRPRPHPRPWGWQGRVTAPALGPLCWNPLPAPPFPPALFSLPLWLHGFSELCAGAVQRSCQSDLPTGTRTREPALS